MEKKEFAYFFKKSSPLLIKLVAPTRMSYMVFTKGVIL